jgi:hypothetical protein
VLVTAQPGRLTSTASPGKTRAALRSKHGMASQPTRAPHPAPSGPGGDPPVDIVGWRVHRLRDAGFPGALAESLARQQVDLHALLQLVDRGCPPHLAARILAPDDTTAVR